MGKRLKDEGFGFVEDKPKTDEFGFVPDDKSKDDFGFVPEEPIKKKDSSTTGSLSSQEVKPVVEMPTGDALKQAGNDMAKAVKRGEQNATITPEKVDIFNQVVNASKAHKEAFKDGVAQAPEKRKLIQDKAEKDLNDALTRLHDVGGIMSKNDAVNNAHKYVNEVIDGKDKPGELQQIANDPGAAITQGVGSFNKGVISTFSALPKSVAILAKPLDKFFGVGPGKETQEYSSYRAGKWLDDKALEWGITATDPDRDNSFWQSVIPNALGNVAAIVLSGGRSVGAEAGGLEAATISQGAAVKKGLVDTGKTLTSAPSITGASAMAAPEFDAAKKAGLSDDEAFDVWAKNYFVGTTEVLPIQNALGRINRLSGGKLTEIVKAGLPGAIEEWIQEFVQQILSNKIAAGSYDPHRDTFQDVLQSAGAGFFVGFILPGIGAAMKRMTPEQRTETNKVLNESFKKFKSEPQQETQDVSNIQSETATAPQENVQNKSIAPQETPQIPLQPETQQPQAVQQETKPTQPEPTVETTKPKELNDLEKTLVKNYPTFSSEDHAKAAELYKKKIEDNPGDRKMHIYKNLLDLHLKMSGQNPAYQERGVDEYQETNKVQAPQVTEKERVIGQYLTRFPGESYNRFGDPNFIKDTPVMRMMYLSKSGTPLDVQAQDMSYTLNPEGDGNDITPQDLIDFVNKYPRGKHQFNAILEDDAKNMADQVVSEKSAEISKSEGLRYALENINKYGITAENIKSPDIQQYLNNEFLFNEEDKKNINTIFDYAKSEEGLQKINSILANGDEQTGAGTGKGSGLPEVQSTEGTGIEPTAGEATKLTDAGYPEAWAKDQPKKKRVTLRSVEKKINALKEKIKANPDPKLITKYQNLKAKHEKLTMRKYSGEQASTEKFYEPPIGAPKRKKAKNSRITVAPIFGGKPKLLKDIMLDLAKSKPGTIYYTKRPAKGRRALGAYYPSMGVTAIKYKGDLDVTAHETGHELDDRFGILDAIPAAQEAAIHAELMDLSNYGSKPPKGHPNAKTYKLGEGMAEYMRAYMVNPDEAAKLYPETTAWIKQAVPADVLTKVEAFGNDIRTYAGLSAHDQIMSNMQFDPTKKKGSILEFFKPKSVSEDGFEITFLDRLGQKFTSDKRFFEKSVDFLESAQGIKLSPENDPRMLARVFLGSNEKLDNMFEKGLVNSRNQRVVDPVTKKHMTLEWLVEPFDNTNEKSLKAEQQETITYMIAERTIELGKRFSREDILTGIGAGVFKDTDVASRKLQEFDALPSDKKDRIMEGARRYREYADRVLRYMVDKGRISQDDYAQIKKDNIQYVALNRILEVAPGEEIVVYKSEKGSSSIGSVKNTLHKIKGSTQLIQNPYESLLQAAIKSTKEADRNEVMQAYGDLFRYQRTMYQDKPVYNSVARPAASGDKNTVQIFVDGKPEFWQLQEDVYQSVKNITETGYTVPMVWTILPKILRASVTNFPVFAIRNRIRDIQQRMIVSNTKGFKGYDIYLDKKTKELTKDLYQLFGGGQSGYYLMTDDFYYKKMDEAINHLKKEKNTILSLPGKMVEGYGKLLGGGERATRLEEYRSAFKYAKKQGMDDYNASIYAAYKSRDLLDFSVAGEYIRVLNQIVPFSNAAVQGLRKTIKAGVDDPGAFAVRFTMYAVIPALLTRALAHSLGRDDEYEAMPSYRRDLFYNIPVGPDLWITIPKPFELGVLSSATERFMSKYVFGQEDAMDGYAGSLAKSVMPVDEAALAIGGFKPIVEVMANYDFFRDQSIIPPDQVGLKLEYRDTDKASRLGLGIQSVFGVDARQADYFIKGTTSYFGDLALRISDLGRDETRYPFNWTLSGLLKGDPLYDSKNVQKVLTFVKENGIHWSDPFYQEMNQMISTYYATVDPKEREELGKEIREFAKNLLEEYQTNDAYKRDNQELEE